MPPSFAELLGTHLHRTHTSVNRLAKLTGVPQRTLANWLNESSRKPQQWQPIVKVAVSLHLTQAEADVLLNAAGHLTLSSLRNNAAATDVELLAKFPSAPKPFQLIADLSTFAGRTTELAELKHALLESGRAAICGLSGMGGVGKTTLAVHLAYQLRNEFPDGVLWARLDTSDTLSILGVFADAYGKDVSQYKDVESRAAVVRSLLAERRALIILDNAETSAQVRPMLPPTGNCAVLITTRHDLSILDGRLCITLEPFKNGSNEAIQLFERYLGQDFVQTHHIPLLEIAALCGYLPLALSIAAGRLANETSNFYRRQNIETRAVTALLSSLRISSTRLDILARDDMGIRSSFDVSYAALTPYQQDLFSTLGIFSGEDFGSGSIAYLTDRTPDQADTELQNLYSLCLVQKSRDFRWRLHPLLQDYAREKLETTNRLLSIIEKTLLMYRQASQEEWAFETSLQNEIPNIRFALDQAYQLKLYQPLIETVCAIYPALSIGAWYLMACTVLEQASIAAHTVSDPEAELYCVNGLAIMQMGLGDTRSGRENLNRALEIAQVLNHDADTADIYMSLGKLEIEMGYYSEAKSCYEKSLALAKKINDRNIEGMVINNLALLLIREARYVEAEVMFLESLEIVRAHQNVSATIVAFMNLGDVSSLQGNWERANTYWQEGLSLARKVNDRASAVALLANIALVHAEYSEWVAADHFFEEAIELAQEINMSRMEGTVRSEFGNILRKQKRLNPAIEQLNRAVYLANEVGDLERKGYTFYYLGMLHLDFMKHEEAQVALDEALAIVKEIHYEILIADVCFVQAKVLCARGKYFEARQMIDDALKIYKHLKLSKQLEELNAWIRTQTDISSI